MTASLMSRAVRPIAVVVFACLLSITTFGRAEQFTPELVWHNLAQVNAREAGPTNPFEFNSADSQLQVLGGFYANYPQPWFPAIDPSRGVLYLPETQFGWQAFSAGGSVAAVDLKTLNLLRRMVIEVGGVQAAPTGLALDSLGQRLFVSDMFGRRLFVADATSGAVSSMFQYESGFQAHPYVRVLNALYGWWGTDLGVFDISGSSSVRFASGHSAINASLLVPNELSKLMYIGYQANVRVSLEPLGVSSLPDSQIVAVDIDPASPLFHQIVWTGTGSAHQLPGGYFQPALDRIRQRLYVPDVKARVLRVFNAAPGPSLHQELAPIPLILDDPNLVYLFGAGAHLAAYTRFTVYPEVDPITGMIYAVVCGRFDTADAVESARPYVLAIHPERGVVARANLPPSIGENAYIQVDPGTRRIIVSNPDSLGTPPLVVLQDLRSSSLLTGAAPGPVTITAPEATLTFSSVQSTGLTTIEPRSITGVDVNLPGQFTLDGGLLYDVSTTAAIAGSITLCFLAAHVDDPAAFEALHVLHAEAGQWVDRTTTRNFATRTICAQTMSLSPFAIVRRTSPAFSPRFLYAVDKSFKAGSTAPLKVQILNWAGVNVSSASLVLRAVSLVKTTDESAVAIADSGNANPDSGFRYDSSLAGYIFNLSTRGLSPGTYVLTVEVGSGHFIQLPFGVR